MSTQETYLYSLCMTVCYKNNYSELLRIADVGKNYEGSGRIRSGLYPFDHDSTHPDVKTISMNRREANPNELHIWRWENQSGDRNKQYSYRTDRVFYELIFLNNPNLNNGLNVNFPQVWDLFDTLIDGFIVPTGFINSLQPQKPFLLVVNQTDTEYICLEIPESSYTCDGNKIRIREDTLLKKCKISLSKVIDTNEYTYNLNTLNRPSGSTLQRRLIYQRRTIHNEEVATLPLKRFSTHLIECFEQTGERLSAQIGDKKVIKSLVSNIIKNVKPDSNLMLFLEEYYAQSNRDPLSLTLESYHPLESVLAPCIKQVSMDEKFFESLVDIFPSLREKYLQILTDGYLDTEKQRLLRHLTPLQSQIDELKNELESKAAQREELKSEITSLVNVKEELLVQIHESEQCRQKFDELLSDKRSGLLRELNTLKELLQCSETTSETAAQNENLPVLTHRPGKHLVCEDDEVVEEMTQFPEMYSLLQENLPEQGTDTPSVLELSKFISALYLCHFPLFCVGTSARDLAHIISITFNNQLPDTICVPSGYNNYSFLVNTIKRMKSDIVVLENIVGFCDEYCYTHLAEDIPEKYMIFLTEYEENLRILPKGIYARMGLIQCDKYFTTQLKSDEQPYPGRITDSIPIPPNSDIRNQILDKLLKLTRGTAVSTGYVNSRTKILQSIAQDDNVDQLIKIIYTELMSIIDIYGVSDDYVDELHTSTDSAVREFRERYKAETE